jgi:hypothetical protein
MQRKNTTIKFIFLFCPTGFSFSFVFFLCISKDKQEKKSGEFFSSSLLCGLRQAREGGIKQGILMFAILWPVLQQP